LKAEGLSLIFSSHSHLESNFYILSNFIKVTPFTLFREKSRYWFLSASPDTCLYSSYEPNSIDTFGRLSFDKDCSLMDLDLQRSLVSSLGVRRTLGKSKSYVYIVCSFLLMNFVEEGLFLIYCKSRFYHLDNTKLTQINISYPCKDPSQIPNEHILFRLNF